MSTPKRSKLVKLVWRYKYFILGWFLIAFLFVAGAMYIYFNYPAEQYPAWHKLADFLNVVGETIIGAGLIGGGIGGVLNFIFEEMKQEEEEAKEQAKEKQENREKRKLFRREIQGKLQKAHDNVELARVLIKSHRSGRTYGEQIRELIMPSLISLKDVKRELDHVVDGQLKNNLDHLRVSLTYMIAYLMVLVEEFEKSYLTISNLQTYQDALTQRMRAMFTEIAEGKKEGHVSLEKKKEFLDCAEEQFKDIDIPSNIKLVWEAMEELDYIWDFIDELRNEKGAHSLYYKFFLTHYFHCSKIVKSRRSGINERLTNRKTFVANLEEHRRIVEKKKSDQPITKHDSLTRKIMENELRFDFETHKMKPLN